MSGAIIAMIKVEKDLCIFCKNRKKSTKDRAINTDGSLVPVIINKMILYQSLKKIRWFYDIDIQDPYFFIKEESPPGTVVHERAGYWTL
jgi:hypothetical protein